MAHTKAGGSSRNGRDSRGQRLGIKLGDGQFCTAGSIIFRQRGTKIFPGTNVGRGNDDTLYALITGYVKFEHIRNRTYASVYPERRVQSNAVDEILIVTKKTTKKDVEAAFGKKPVAKKTTSKSTKSTKTTK